MAVFDFMAHGERETEGEEARMGKLKDAVLIVMSLLPLVGLVLVGIAVI
jgi:hypothetical protein